VYSSSQGCHTATGTHTAHGITQCYLPPGRGDIPALDDDDDDDVRLDLDLRVPHVADAEN